MINFVVITRFSLRLAPKWELIAFGDDVKRESWFKYRVALYKQTLHKSLANLKTKPEAVYLLMDTDDRELYEQYALQGKPQLSASNIPIVPIFCERLEFQQAIVEDLNARGVKKNIASCRVDSDDILHPDYFTVMQQHITERKHKETNEDDLWLISTDGYRASQDRLQRIYYKNAPFICKFAKHDNFSDHVYGFNHVKIASKRNVSRLQTKQPLWLQVIHDSNVSNDFFEPQAQELFNEKRNKKVAKAGSQLRTYEHSDIDDWLGYSFNLNQAFDLESDF